LPLRESADDKDMFTLIILMAGLGAVDALALRFGVDSRQDVGRKF
jgi:hypothetical protein